MGPARGDWGTRREWEENRQKQGREKEEREVGETEKDWVKTMKHTDT